MGPAGPVFETRSAFLMVSTSWGTLKISSLKRHYSIVLALLLERMVDNTGGRCHKTSSS
jgi:hypothetical protein